MLRSSILLTNNIHPTKYDNAWRYDTWHSTPSDGDGRDHRHRFSVECPPDNTIIISISINSPPGRYNNLRTQTHAQEIGCGSNYEEWDTHIYVTGAPWPLILEFILLLVPNWVGGWEFGKTTALQTQTARQTKRKNGGRRRRSWS
jgi:hypothetical protein